VKRGDLVTIALSGDYGKPRPALVIQSELFEAHPSITILPVTSELHETPLFRVRVEPSRGNGLRKVSEIMIDKTHTVARDRVGANIGRLDDETMLAVNRALAVFLGFA
jgi:mRNA interferase MazF